MVDNFFKFENVTYLTKSTFDIKYIDTDFCIYLAAISNDPMGANFAEQTYSVNEIEAIRIARLCKLSQRDVRFILASSCSVYDLQVTMLKLKLIYFLITD